MRKTSGKQTEKWDNSHRRFRIFISDSTASFCLVDFSGSMKFTYLIHAISIEGKTLSWYNWSPSDGRESEVS